MPCWHAKKGEFIPFEIPNALESETEATEQETEEDATLKLDSIAASSNSYMHDEPMQIESNDEQVEPAEVMVKKRGWPKSKSNSF